MCISHASIGIECVGKVVDPADSGLHVGQRVVSLMNGMGRQFDGSYAEYTLLPAGQVYSLKASWTVQYWPPFPKPSTTVWGSSTEALQLKAGETLPIRGDSSACGLTAAQLAVSTWGNGYQHHPQPGIYRKALHGKRLTNYD